MNRQNKSFVNKASRHWCCSADAHLTKRYKRCAWYPYRILLNSHEWDIALETFRAAAAERLKRPQYLWQLKRQIMHGSSIFANLGFYWNDVARDQKDFFFIAPNRDTVVEYQWTKYVPWKRWGKCHKMAQKVWTRHLNQICHDALQYHPAETIIMMYHCAPRLPCHTVIIVLYAIFSPFSHHFSTALAAADPI